MESGGHKASKLKRAAILKTSIVYTKSCNTAVDEQREDEDGQLKELRGRKAFKFILHICTKTEIKGWEDDSGPWGKH